MDILIEILGWIFETVTNGVGLRRTKPTIKDAKVETIKQVDSLPPTSNL